MYQTFMMKNVTVFTKDIEERLAQIPFFVTLSPKSNLPPKIEIAVSRGSEGVERAAGCLHDPEIMIGYHLNSF